MTRSTIIAVTCLSVLIAIYLVEPEAKHPETLAIIGLMVIGLIAEKLIYRRGE